MNIFILLLILMWTHYRWEFLSENKYLISWYHWFSTCVLLEFNDNEKYLIRYNLLLLNVIKIEFRNEFLALMNKLFVLKMVKTQGITLDIVLLQTKTNKYNKSFNTYMSLRLEPWNVISLKSNETWQILFSWPVFELLLFWVKVFSYHEQNEQKQCE